jgi:hypothetical protein
MNAAGNLYVWEHNMELTQEIVTAFSEVCQWIAILIIATGKK